jgi:hypothetical protein
MKIALAFSVLLAIAAFTISTSVPSPLSAQTTQRTKAAPASQRTAVLDALRPRAVRDLGPPVEFVVREFRQQGNLAFVSVTAQRPGGCLLDLARTPIGRNGAAAEMDGPSIQAFFKQSRGIWRVDLYAIGATDLWYMDPQICANYAMVMTESLCPGNVVPR